MGKRERYEPGTFSWVDLSTSDAAGAKTFYGELFGWEFDDQEIPGGGVYVMCFVRGDAVAAMVEQNQHSGHWNNYVTVASADETAAKAKQLGARVIEEPFDVMDAGRMALFADPGGAMLCVWQPREHIGAGRVNDVGCLTLNELQTRDPASASAFYGGLFGWETETVEENGKLVYASIKNAGSLNGGIMPMSEEHGEAPSVWIPYFTVASCDGAIEKIRGLGGGIFTGPLDVPAGRISVAHDPQGAVFAIFEGETDD